MTAPRAEGWYRRLLRLYPPDFRRRFAREMSAAYAEDLARARGFGARLTFRAISAWHAVSGALAERMRRPTPVPPADAPPRHRFGHGLQLDLRLAWRALRQYPALSAIVILTLGLGIGSGTAVFSVLDTLVFRPLPFERDDRLLRLRDTVDRPGEASWWYTSSARSFLFVKEGATSFSAVTGAEYRQFNVTGGEAPETVVGSAVADGWLETLGIQPALGRGFTPEEVALQDAARAVVIGHGWWVRRFGSRRDVLGSPLTLDGATYTVVGVMPPGFNFPYGAEVWIMGRFDPAATGSGPYVVARLADGVTRADAARELDLLSAAARETYPDSHRAIRFTAVGMREDLIGNRDQLGFVLFGAVGLLLLIACGNVANLLLVRATARRRDFALRTALGATPGRQIRHTLVETGLLAALGWGLGLALAFPLTDAMAILSPPAGDSLGAFFHDVGIDTRVLAFSLLLTAATVVLTTLPAALRASRADVRDAIAEGHPLGSRSGSPWLRGVVIAEVALVVVLFTGATAMVDDLQSLRRTDLGFRPDGRVVAPLAIAEARYPDGADRVRLLQRTEERLRALPGVEAVGATQHTPVSNGDWTGQMTIEGGHESTPDNILLANMRTVTRGYFEAIGITFVEGRTFSVAESEEARNVVVVTETMARTHWPGRSALGRRVKFGPVAGDNPWLTVVGVVRDVKEEWNGVEATWYVPYPQTPIVTMNLVIAHRGDPTQLRPALRAAVADVDPEQPLGEIRSLTGLVDQSFAPERFGAFLAGAFAGFGLLLASLGVYGVLAFAVRQRVREIGVRMALGASARRVVRRIVGGGLALLATGLAVGLIGLVGLGRLPRVEWADGDVNQFRLLADGVGLSPARVLLTLTVLLAATLVASYLPARRATRISPTEALRDG